MNEKLSNPSEGVLKLKTPSPGTSIANACADVLVLANRKRLLLFDPEEEAVSSS